MSAVSPWPVVVQLHAAGSSVQGGKKYIEGMGVRVGKAEVWLPCTIGV